MRCPDDFDRRIRTYSDMTDSALCASDIRLVVVLFANSIVHAYTLYVRINHKMMEGAIEHPSTL